MARTAAKPAGAAPRVPVLAGVVSRIDLPLELASIGTAQPFNSVLVRSRVDGQIVRLTFTEGAEVKDGDLLAEIDPRPFEAGLALALAAKSRDSALLDNARLDLNRASRLVTAGAGTTQQFDTSRSLVAQLEATLKADQAQIDAAKLQLEYSRVTAPIDGRVGTRLVDAGNIVHSGDTAGIVTINQVRPITVDFSLPADDLGRIRAKLRAGTLAVSAVDSSGQELGVGRLAVVDNQINQATASIRFKATFDNADEALWPGRFVTIRLRLDTLRGVITVPLTAVVRGPDGPYAFAIGDDQRIAKRPVKVGHMTSALAVIESGLAEGERVVTDGQYRVQEGTLVDIMAPPSARPSS